jgi:tetratricopeptide (TPR) repeat protein
VRVDPRSATARTNLAAIYRALDRHPDAVNELLQAGELTKLTPPLLLNLADSLGRLERYDEMLNTLEQITALEDNATAWERKGSALFRLKRYDDALAAFRRSTEVDPNHYPGHNGVAVCLLNTYLWSNESDMAAKDEAVRALRRSLQIEPQQPRIADLLSRYR